MKSHTSVLREVLALRYGLLPYLSILPPFPQRGWDDGFGAREGARTAWTLKVLNAYPDGLHERINKRGALETCLKAHAEDGKVIVLESGMDCDCVSYSGRMHEIPATVHDYEKLHSRVHEGSDGTFSFEIARPGDCKGVKYRSRDLALEAYEDGHPHHVTFALPEGD